MDMLIFTFFTYIFVNIGNITYPINIETDIFQGTKKTGID